MLACGAVGAPAAEAQLLKRPLAIENARILTMDGAVVENGTLLVKGEKIIGLGPGVKTPLLAKKVDARGGTVTPGLIDVMSALGVGGSAGGSANPTRRAEDGFDRYDTAALLDALGNGVTAVYVSPGSAGGIYGTGAVLRLAPVAHRPQSFGRVLRSEACLCIELGSGGAVARLKTLSAVAKQLRDALAYRRSLEEYEEKLTEYNKKLQERSAKKEPAKKDSAKKDSAKPGSRPVASRPTVAEEKKKEESQQKPGEAKPSHEKKAEALKKPARPGRNPKAVLLLRAIDNELPVRVRADRSEDILNALELAKEFSLDMILEGAAEAHLVAEQIADAEVPVVLGSMARSGVRRNDRLRRAAENDVAVLSAAGVRWSVGSGGRTAGSARFVAQNAQLAAARDSGNDPLRSVTAGAAEGLRVGEQIGRLRAGMLADFVIWSGDPLDPASTVLRVYVGGALVYEPPEETEEGGAK